MKLVIVKRFWKPLSTWHTNVDTLIDSVISIGEMMVSVNYMLVFNCREIASAIKKLLDAVNEVVGFIPGTSGKQAVEQRKKEFVKYSKKFSTTLKEYFKEGQWVSTPFSILKWNKLKVAILVSLYMLSPMSKWPLAFIVLRPTKLSLINTSAYQYCLPIAQ